MAETRVHRHLSLEGQHARITVFSASHVWSWEGSGLPASSGLIWSSCPQVSIAVGCATRDRTVPFCSTFAAFFTRAFDQIRMAAISESNINLCGSHCGVSIGEFRPVASTSTLLALSTLEPVSQSSASFQYSRGRRAISDGPGRPGHVSVSPYVYRLLPK